MCVCLFSCGFAFSLSHVTSDTRSNGGKTTTGVVCKILWRYSLALSPGGFSSNYSFAARKLAYCLSMQAFCFFQHVFAKF